jgi:hypothetical protein
MKHNPIPAILTAKDPPVTWLLPGMIPQGSLIHMAGEASAGKSFFCYALTMAMATRTPFLGMTPAEPVPILYCDVENSIPDRNGYLRSIWHGLGEPRLDLIDDYFWTSHFELGNPNWDDVLSAAIRTYQPALFVVDMATSAFRIQDENDNAEASRIINRLRCLQNLVAPTATGIILRHANTFLVNGVRTARGAKTWIGSTDATWFFVGEQGGRRKDGLRNTKLEVAKVRAWGLENTLHIKPERLGAKNEDGIRLVLQT